jgi:hypothetical protein
MKIFRYCSLFIIFLLAIRCSEDSIVDTKSYDRGDIISSKEIETYTPEAIVQLLSFAQIPVTIQPEYSVKIISIKYQTITADGDLTEASGALYIPQSDIDYPLLSIQHGTETERTKVASVSPLQSVEGVVGLITGATGYVTCIPDYIGFGVSKKLHTYVHAKSLSLSVIDFLRASRTYCDANNINLTDQLFLGGYSEGGYASLAAQREIQQNYSSEFKITANAPMAGPYDLLGTTETILGKSSYSSPIYIAYLLTAYNNIYSWNRLDDFFKAPYAGKMSGLFDGTNSYSTINDQLPSEITQLLNETFVNNVIAEADTAVINALKENTLLDWVPDSPVRFFHGNSDDTVPYENATTARDIFLENGATSVELISIPGGTHSTSGLPAVLGMIDWFNSLRDN